MKTVQGGDPLTRHGSPFDSTSWYVIGMACLRFQGTCQGVPDIKVCERCACGMNRRDQGSSTFDCNLTLLGRSRVGYFRTEWIESGMVRSSRMRSLLSGNEALLWAFVSGVLAFARLGGPCWMSMALYGDCDGMSHDLKGVAHGTSRTRGQHAIRPTAIGEIGRYCSKPCHRPDGKSAPFLAGPCRAL